jgi:flagellar capping protein FliD
MGSPITFSGFNKIDFGVVLNAIMQQESRPLQVLEARGSELQATDSALGTLPRSSTRCAARSGPDEYRRSPSITLPQAATPRSPAVASSTGAVAGRYDIVVSSSRGHR